MATLDTVIIRTQHREWVHSTHDNRSPSDGYYVNKGNVDFLLTLDTNIVREHKESIEKAFDEIYNQGGMKDQYVFSTVEVYNEPRCIKDIASMTNLINKHING